MQFSTSIRGGSTFGGTGWARIGVLAGLAVAAWPSDEAMGQGCVAVRGGGMSSLHGIVSGGMHPEAGDWQAFLNYRWLHSDRHFVGDDEQEHRQADGTEVINDSHFIDIGLSYTISPRYSVSLTLPFVYSDRSSMYEHKGNASGERYHTQAGGLGDIRMGGYAWLWNPESHPKGNIQLGLGFKAPSGDSEATDIFMRNSGPTLDYVDQSIQPGDGGWGFTVEFYGYRELFKGGYGYLQGFYLFNPDNINDTPTRVANINSTDPFNFMSVPDQYSFRGGLGYAVKPDWGLGLTLGGRIDGVPSEDLIGDSEGFRRPGYSVSIEPGLTWMKGKWSATFTAPVAVYRNRVKSVRDKQTGRHGDAAFADFFTTFSISRNF